MAHKVGTLVRVKDSAWDTPNYIHARSNHEMVKRNGYIWIVTEVEGSGITAAYVCRSIATGHNGAVWVDREVEGADDDP